MPGRLENLLRRRNELLDGLKNSTQQIYRQLTTGTTTVEVTGTIDDGNTTITIGGVTYAVTVVADPSDGSTILPARKEDLDILESLDDSLRGILLHMEHITGTTYELDKD